MRRKRIADRILVDGNLLGLLFGKRTVRRIVGTLIMPPDLQVAKVAAPLYVRLKIAGVHREVIVERVPQSLADDGTVLYQATRVIDDYWGIVREIADHHGVTLQEPAH